MTQVMEKEQRAALTGKLGNSFAAAATFDRLQNEILGSQPAETREKTATMLSAFFGAAERLKDREAEFNNRNRDTTRDASQGFDLKVNLRSPDHFTAIREFKGMAHELVALDPVAGQELVKAVENSIAAAPKQRAKI